MYSHYQFLYEILSISKTNNQIYFICSKYILYIITRISSEKILIHLENNNININSFKLLNKIINKCGFKNVYKYIGNKINKFTNKQILDLIICSLEIKSLFLIDNVNSLYFDKLSDEYFNMLIKICIKNGMQQLLKYISKKWCVSSYSMLNCRKKMIFIL